MVDIGGPRLHLLESGHGHPAVILEAGIAASCLNWTSLQAELAKCTRVYSYDRAGLGWSDPAGSPRTISRALEDLHALLTAAQVSAPFIMMGHSYGGLLVRCYAIKYPDRVAGLVLLDPLAAGDWLRPSEAQWKLLKRGSMLSRRGALLTQFGVPRLGLWMLSSGLRFIPKLVARMAGSESGESAISRLVREVQKMPRETWPMVQAHWCQPKSFLAMANYLESLPASASEAFACGHLPAHIQVTILSASNSSATQLAERDAIAHHSLHGKHVIASKSGHWIHFDEPELVIQAVRDVAAHSSL